MKLYGIAYIHDWPALCFGNKAWCFKLTWARKLHRFKWYSYTTTSKDVWWQRINSHPFRFIGLMILPNNELYDLDE